MKRNKKCLLVVAITTLTVLLYLRPVRNNTGNEEDFRLKKGKLESEKEIYKRQDVHPGETNFSKRKNGIHPRQFVFPQVPSVFKSKGLKNQLSEINAKQNVGSVSSMFTKPNLKVYIYKLPEKFNVDIHHCTDVTNNGKCFMMGEDGFGALLYREGEFHVHRTHQFSLEVLLHNQLLHSKYITQNPEEADLFYIPAYFGLQYFCNKPQPIKRLIQEMFTVVKAMPYFGQGKPHLSALAMIEGEMAQDVNPVLQNMNYRKVTCIVIEKMASEDLRNHFGLKDQRVIVAPYPSYVHLDPRAAVGQTISSPSLTSRQVFLLIAASTRRTNPFRNILLDQFGKNVSGLSFQDYAKLHPDIISGSSFHAWLVTQQCVGQQENITNDWMQNSVFCLQPHGDSPTRKSFYDSILSGCIPVIFKFEREKVEYPFQRVLNYSDFIVSIDAERISSKKELVLNILQTIPKSEVQRLHDNVLKVARQLQYSVFDTQGKGYRDVSYSDALDMIIQEAKYMYGL